MEFPLQPIQSDPNVIHFAFAMGIALIKYARVKISLEHFLFGNVLGIADTDLLTSYCISVVTLLSLVALQRPLLLALFEASPIFFQSETAACGS